MKRTVFARFATMLILSTEVTAQAAHTHEYTKQNSKVYVCECGKEKPLYSLKGERVITLNCNGGSLYGGIYKTDNVETVVLLSHKKPDGHINVKVEFGEGEGKVPLDNIAKRAEEYKPKERVTYKMIKEYIEAKYDFKVHTAYIAEVK